MKNTYKKSLIPLSLGFLVSATLLDASPRRGLHHHVDTVREDAIGPRSFEKQSPFYDSGTSSAATKTSNEWTQTSSQSQNELPTNAAKNNNSGIPVNANPGECFVQVLVPAEYKTVTERVMVSEPSKRYETVEPTYRWVDKKVQTKAASFSYETIPAKYKTVEKKVMVKPASERIVEIPATYKWVEERVLVKPATTQWIEGEKPLEDVNNITKGEIMCLVKIPAEYKTVKRKVVDQPARTQVETVPAEYKTIAETVMVSPAKTKRIEQPAQFETVRVREVATPAQKRMVSIPAAYETVTRQVVARPSETQWRQVICETNMTPEFAADLEMKLKEKGFNVGNIDGVIDDNTYAAIEKYQTSNNLPTGGITLETIRSLEINLSEDRNS